MSRRSCGPNSVPARNLSTAAGSVPAKRQSTTGASVPAKRLSTAGREGVPAIVLSTAFRRRSWS